MELTEVRAPGTAMIRTALLLFPVLLLACTGSGEVSEESLDGAAAEVSSDVRGDASGDAESWRPLFDGETLDGWRGFGQEEPPGAWQVVDGTLALTGEGQGGDLITEESFDDFELSLEWRVEEGGNSGIFYLVTEDANTIWEAAPEMQVLDDANHADGQSPLTSAGSNFALHPVPRGVVRPAGEWNEARIVVRGDSVEHWLNGTRVVAYELGSEDWQRRVAESKFADMPLYGRARRGHIGLQDHGDPVWFRNIRVRELE